LKQRRSLTHVGGSVRTTGDPRVAAKLAEALDVAPAPEPRDDGGAEDDPDRVHVHGFHTYPARMHPATAARLVRASTSEGARVLDPFCGSGTVLIEAMIAGRQAAGTDLNPLAVRLATLKTARLDATAREAITQGARNAAAFADERRQRRAGATHRYPPEDVASFDPHVLLELDSLRAAVTGLEPTSPVRGALELVLSAILVKLSRRASDTATGATARATRRLAAGYPSRLFIRKAEELVTRVAALEALLPPGVPAGRVTLDDASRLKTLGASTIDAVVTSPPYVATYDYLEHHALRLRWLGLDARGFASGEIGSRRRYGRLDGASARQTWSRELGASLRAIARVCRPGAPIALVLADSAVEGEALRADALVEGVAEGAGLVVLARASQDRPHFHGPTARAFRDAPRAEHAIALAKR
jgi:DNA modification methylase